MARINVEDSLWSDARFMRLCIKMGDELRAAGAVLVAWKTAQKFWCPDKKPIPEHIFKDVGLPEALLECRLADRTSEGVRMRGSEEHFAWWFDRRKGGVASAAVRKEKFGTSQPTIKKPRAEFEHSSETTELAPNCPEALTLTPPLTLSLTQTLKKEECTERSQSETFNACCSEFAVEPIRGFLEKSKIKTSTQLLWLTTYDNNVAWLRQEILKAMGWLDANPSRRPKANFSRFLGAWFSRGWENYRKSLPATPLVISQPVITNLPFGVLSDAENERTRRQIAANEAVIPADPERVKKFIARVLGGEKQ